jgi:hypothetical protein
MSKNIEFKREDLLSAFDEIGAAAIVAGTRLEICIYGGSALIIASNFRWSTEDVDTAELERPWPQWLAQVVERIHKQRGWLEDWFNDGVATFLAKTKADASDHALFGTFPRADRERVGLTVFVPKPDYLFALKLKAGRVNNEKKWIKDSADIANLAHVLGITDVEQGIAIFKRFFPALANDTGRERFILKTLLGKITHDDPRYSV